MKVISKSIWGAQYQILDDTDQEIGEINFNSWQTSATINVLNDEATLKNRKWYSSDKIITYKGEELGTSHFKYGFKQTQLRIEFKGALFIVQRQGLFSQTFDVFLSEEMIPTGTITKESIMKGNYTIDLPDKIEKLFQAVILTLLIFLEKYQAAAAS